MRSKAGKMSRSRRASTGTWEDRKSSSRVCNERRSKPAKRGRSGRASSGRRADREKYSRADGIGGPWQTRGAAEGREWDLGRQKSRSRAGRERRSRRRAGKVTQPVILSRL
jgi:hypothetical protein